MELSTSTLRIAELEDTAGAQAFRTLNEEWIRRHFTLEPRDVESLSDPRGAVLARGGRVYLAWIGEEAVGCVALVPLGEGVWELSKMAVAPHQRGRGIGRKLLQYAIAEARRLGAASLFLGSNTKLADAVHLYESVGFQHVERERLPPLPYARANVFMELRLGGEENQPGAVLLDQ
jgi:putative acetyltransferase